MLQRAREVSLNRLDRAVVMILSWVIDIVGRDIEAAGDGLFIHIVAHHAAVVRRDKLPWGRALPDKGRLPVKEVGNSHLTPACPFQLVAGRDGAIALG